MNIIAVYLALSCLSFATAGSDSHPEHNTSLMEFYNPTPLHWRPFTDDELGGLALPSPMRDKPYILDHMSCEEGLEIPPLDLTNGFLRLEDFCVTPSELLDDARLSGLDPSGKQRLPLTEEHWHSLRRTGRLNVPSRSFAGQNHTWQLARGVYSGVETIQADFKTGCGMALDQLVYIGDSLCVPSDATENSISFYSGLKHLSEAVTILMDGVTQCFRSFHTRLYSDPVIDRLVAEAKESYIRKRVLERHNISLPLPHTRQDEFWYLKNRSFMDDLWTALQTHGAWSETEPPSDKEFSIALSSHEQYMLLKRKHEDFCPSETSSIEKEISARVSPLAAKRLLDQNNDAVQSEKRKYWIELLLTNSTFGKYEMQQDEAAKIYNDLNRDDDEEAARIAEAKVSEEVHWMLLSNVYRQRRIRMLKQREMARLGETFHDRLVKRLREHKSLTIEATKRELSVEFDIQHGTLLRQKLKSKVSPPPVQFQVLQFDPANWKQRGSSFDRYKLVEVDLGRPLWRLRYSFLLFWTAFKQSVGGSAHFLKNGPLSLRALISLSPYHAIARPSPDPSTLTSTLRSRLKNLFEMLSDQKRKFENEPDFGIIPKSVTRLLFQCGQFMKGLVGATSITVFMVIGTLISSTLCLACLAGSPVMGLLWMAVATGFQLFLFDIPLARSSSKPVSVLFQPTYPTFRSVAPILKIAVIAPARSMIAVLELAVTTLRIVFIHPMLFAFCIVSSMARFLIRLTRDSFLWLLLRRLALVPATSEDTWLAHRIHGPGVSAQIYSHLPLNAAKVAVLRALTVERLSTHRKLRENEMDAPYEDFVAMFDVSDYGIRTSGICAMPTTEVNTILDEMDRHTRNSRREQNRVLLKGLDVQNDWDAFAAAILKDDPENQKAIKQLKSSIRNEYEGNLLAKTETVVLQDARWDEIVARINSLKPASPLERLTNSTLLVMARWLFVVKYFSATLQEMLHVNGNFRMNEEELESLWRFTLAAVEDFAAKQKSELQSIARSSEWISDRLLDSLVQETANRSVAVRSFQLLLSLFGIESLTETLESLDKSLVYEKVIKQ